MHVYNTKKICEKIFPIGIGDGSFLFPSAFISTPSNSQVGYSDSHGNPISIMNPIPTVTSSKRLSLSHVCVTGYVDISTVDITSKR